MNTNNHNLKYLFSIASNDTNLPKHVNQINQQKIISINKFPIFSSIILCFIILGCIFSDFIVNHNPFIFYLQNLNQSPNSNFILVLITLVETFFLLFGMVVEFLFLLVF